jgi:Flp pilus assembly protein TadB
MKSSVFVSCLAVFASAALLAGCGLAETSAVAAAEGASSAEQVKQGKELEAKVQRDIDAAQKKAADQLAGAEKQSE